MLGGVERPPSRGDRVKALFLVNRLSGTWRHHDIPSIIDKYSPFEHEIRPCEDLDQVIPAAIAAGFDLICAVGGDGTVHEVARHLIGTPAALGIVPIGSGNGFARHIGLPIAVEHSLRACTSGRVVTIDTASVSGIPFIGTMGLGYDAWIAAEFASHSTRGLWTYLRTGLRGLFSYEPEWYEIEIAGQHLEHRAFLVAVANASQYGNNARIAPAASLQDGMLDLVIIERRSLAAAARLFTGSIERAAGVTILRAAHIEIRRRAAGLAHLDGEPVVLPEKLAVDVVPRSLSVLLPDTGGSI